VARFFVSLFRRRPSTSSMDPVLVNGDAGVLLRGTFDDGSRLLAVIGFAVADGQITGIYSQLNPAKLGSLADGG
jgi:RNA polymerase sigma-70 factor (ECF subfamily)